MYKYKRNGFTLVELMAVIIIISLIALLTFPNIINQIKKTKKSNNKMIEDVVIEQAKKYVSDNKEDLLEDEYCLSISTLIDNDYIKEDIVNINNIKDNKVVHITLDNNNSYEVVDKNKCFLSAVKYLLKKTNPITVTNYTDGDNHEMYTFEHEVTDQTPALTDYRYIGSDPYNYVEFNNELWRIIGVFSVEDENGNWEERVKIVRDSRLSDRMAYKTNGWQSSPINTYLNVEYSETITTANLISDANYYLGTINAAGNGVQEYNLERSGSGKWTGKLALIYASDYIYTFSLGVNDICFTNNANCTGGNSNGAMPSKSWIFLLNTGDKWIISSFTRRYINNGANLKYIGGLNYNFSIHPTLYLSSKVKITSGDGTVSNPYKLSM